MIQGLKYLIVAICLIVAIDGASGHFLSCLRSSCKAYEEIDKRLTDKVGNEWNLSKNYAAIHSLLDEERAKVGGSGSKHVLAALEDLVELEALRTDTKCDERSTEILTRILSDFDLTEYTTYMIERKEIKSRLAAVVYESYVDAVTSCRRKYTDDLVASKAVISDSVNHFFDDYIEFVQTDIDKAMGPTWIAPCRYDYMDSYYTSPKWKSYSLIGKGLYEALRDVASGSVLDEANLDGKINSFIVEPCNKFVASYDISTPMKYLKLAHQTKVSRTTPQTKKFDYLFRQVARHFICKSLSSGDVKKFKSWTLEYMKNKA